MNIIRLIIYLTVVFTKTSVISSKIYEGLLSPCPRVFHYEHNGRNWIGVINVLPSLYNKFLNSNITLSVKLRRPYYPISNENSIDLVCSTEHCLQNVLHNNQSIKFIISFSQYSTSFIPSVVRIALNDENICGNNDVKDYNLKPIEQFELRHSVYISRKNTPSIARNPRAQVLTSTHIQNRIQNRNDNLCGRSGTPLKFSIKNHEAVSPGFWPWLVAIYKKRLHELQYHCSGTLISDKLVLTAAHCLWLEEPSQPKQLLIAIGRYNLRDWTEKDSRLLNVSAFYFHQNYMQEGNRFDADIALIRLSKSIVFSRLIRPICLPYGNQLRLPQIGTFIAWKHEGENMFNVPRLMNMEMLTRQECVTTNSIFKHISTNRTFCAVFGNGLGPCDKDAGGGIANWGNGHWFIAGVFSVALADPLQHTCKQNAPIGFTDVSQFVDWIEHIKSMIH